MFAGRAIYVTDVICTACGVAHMRDFCAFAEGSTGVGGDAEKIVSECPLCGYEIVHMAGAEHLVEKVRDKWRGGEKDLEIDAR